MTRIAALRRRLALTICPELGRDAFRQPDHASELDLLDLLGRLPIWRNGRRPAWWGDIEVRAFLTSRHRQMSVLEAEREGVMRFGSRCPRKSAIGVYWQRLDQVDWRELRTGSGAVQ